MIRELKYDFARLGDLCEKPLGSVDLVLFKASVRTTWEQGRNGKPYADATCRIMRYRLQGFLVWVNRQLGQPGRYAMPPLVSTRVQPGEHCLDPGFLRSLIHLIVLSRRSPGWELMSPVLQLMLAYGSSPEEIAAIKVSDCDFSVMAITWPDGTVRQDFPSLLALEEIRIGLGNRAFAFHEKETEVQGAQRIRDVLKKLYRRKRPNGPGATALKRKFQYLPRRMQKTVKVVKDDPEGALRVLSQVSTLGKAKAKARRKKAHHKIKVSKLPPKRKP